jgi:hypothetical protein
MIAARFGVRKIGRAQNFDGQSSRAAAAESAAEPPREP